MFATWQLLNFNFLNKFYHLLCKNAGPEHKTQVNDEADIREATKNQRLKINRHHRHQKKNDEKTNNSPFNTTQKRLQVEQL